MATYYEEEKKGGGFAGKLLAVFLGFLFGIIVTIGSIAGVGYYLYAKMRIREGINLVGQITGNDIKYQDYISDEYAEKNRFRAPQRSSGAGFFFLRQDDHSG